MEIGTQATTDKFLSGQRIKECREWRSLSRAQLIEKIELLPDNHGKDRSEKQLSYLESGARPLSLEYATLIAQALQVRVEYLLLKDDYKTEIERIGAHATTRNEKQDFIMKLMELHCYRIESCSWDELPPGKITERGECRPHRVKLISPKGSMRFLSHKELLSIIEEIDDYIEYKCAVQFKKSIDGVKNIYTLE